VTDRPTDESLIKKLYEVSGVMYFFGDLQDMLECVIKELYYYNMDIALKLRNKHINRAIYKFTKAKEKRPIYNTKQYFKACLLSAILETELDELEDSD